MLVANKDPVFGKNLLGLAHTKKRWCGWLMNEDEKYESDSDTDTSGKDYIDYLKRILSNPIYEDVSDTEKFNPFLELDDDEDDIEDEIDPFNEYNPSNPFNKFNPKKHFINPFNVDFDARDYAIDEFDDDLKEDEIEKPEPAKIEKPEPAKIEKPKRPKRSKHKKKKPLLKRRRKRQKEPENITLDWLWKS